jgi:transposase InsO family protein
MPWKNIKPMQEKQRFINLAHCGRFTITELCEDFGISRKTGHKWLVRYADGGLKSLEEQSRAPKTVPARTDPSIERLIIKERRRKKTWGPKKIRQRLITQHGIENPPALSTIGGILKREGLIESRRQRAGIFKVERSDLTEAESPNHVMAVDYKGWFRTGDGERFDPLTVTDLYSRYILRTDGLPQATTRYTLRSFRTLFRNVGLPQIIRVDNGAPFASIGPGGLSKLSVWWISLGIEVEFTRPGCPQDNGSHERMHKTMKAECCTPPSANGQAQQQRMNRWKKEFNHERPHEALCMRCPADLYQASPRRLDESIKPDLYDLGVETKEVNAAGFIRLNGSSCYVGESFGGVDVAIERDESGLYKVRYANVNLGVLPDSPNARLRPPAYAERWAKKSCRKK